MSIGQDRNLGGFGETSFTGWWTEEILIYSPGPIIDRISYPYTRVEALEDNFVLNICPVAYMTRH